MVLGVTAYTPAAIVSSNHDMLDICWIGRYAWCWWGRWNDAVGDVEGQSLHVEVCGLGCIHYTGLAVVRDGLQCTCVVFCVAHPMSMSVPLALRGAYVVRSVSSPSAGTVFVRYLCGTVSCMCAVLHSTRHSACVARRVCLDVGTMPM